MSPDDKRIAIACACGWRHEIRRQYAGQPNYGGFGKNTHLSLGHRDRKFTTIEGLPDYLNDLNALMEPCKLLAAQGWRCMVNMGTDGTWECFFTKRGDTDTIPQKGDHYGADDTLSGALAEAVLRTIGKWTDS